MNIYYTCCPGIIETQYQVRADGRGGGQRAGGGSALHYYLPVQIQSLHLTIVFGTNFLGLIFLGTDFFGTKFLGTDFLGLIFLGPIFFGTDFLWTIFWGTNLLGDQ